MNKARHKKGDSAVIGFIAGFFVPFLAFLLFFLVRSAGADRMEYFSAMNVAGITPKLMALSLLPDVIVFFFFLRTDRLYSARGLILSLFAHGIIILTLKFI